MGYRDGVRGVGFSITSLTFAAVGVAALVAYAVSRRTREIGVRVALGAQRHHLFALILRGRAPRH